jgi:hypothetical protein
MPSTQTPYLWAIGLRIVGAFRQVGVCPEAWKLLERHLHRYPFAISGEASVSVVDWHVLTNCFQHVRSRSEAQNMLETKETI